MPVRTPLAAVTLSLVMLVACGDHPVTWEERYARAMAELGAAGEDIERFYALPDATKAAFELGKLEEARTLATELLDLAPRFRGDWNYGNAIHDGHMVLGRAALREGAIEQAKQELLLAGSTPGSPQLDSFGPNMSLARDMLEAGHSETVIEYYALCGEFWEREDGRLRRWTALAEKDRLPDFGANLLY
jgi:hypothetical protein